MLTISHSFLANDVKPLAGFREQQDDFVELVSYCLRNKWVLTRNPSDDEWIEFVLRGKAFNLLEKKWSDDLGNYHQKLHILRGYRGYAIMHYDLCRYKHGRWAAWLEVVEGIPTYDKRDRF